MIETDFSISCWITDKLLQKLYWLQTTTMVAVSMSVHYLNVQFMVKIEENLKFEFKDFKFLHSIGIFNVFSDTHM